jgi:hypothetical protein
MVGNNFYGCLMCITVWISQCWTLIHLVDDDTARFGDLKKLVMGIMSIFTSGENAVVTQIIIYARLVLEMPKKNS